MYFLLWDPPGDPKGAPKDPPKSNKYINKYMNRKMNYRHPLNYQNKLPAGDVCKKSMEPLGPSGGLEGSQGGPLNQKYQYYWGRVTKIEIPKKTLKLTFQETM